MAGSGRLRRMRYACNSTERLNGRNVSLVRFRFERLSSGVREQIWCLLYTRSIGMAPAYGRGPPRIDMAPAVDDSTVLVSIHPDPLNPAPGKMLIRRAVFRIAARIGAGACAADDKWFEPPGEVCGARAAHRLAVRSVPAARRTLERSQS